MSIASLQGFERLSKTIGTTLIEDDKGLKTFPTNFYRNFIGVGAPTLGNFWGLSGTHKFPYAMKMEKRDMLIAVARIANSNLALAKIQDFVPNEPSRDHPDYYGATRKWRFQLELADYTSRKARACLVDVSQGIALNHYEDFHAKFPNMAWDYMGTFVKDLRQTSNRQFSTRKSEVEKSVFKVIGTREARTTWKPDQPEADSVPSRAELQHATAARRVIDAPRQVKHQLQTSRRQWTRPNAAVSLTKPELAQITAQERLQITQNDHPFERSLVENAESLFKAQVASGRWYSNLSKAHQEQMDAGNFKH